MAVLFSPLLHPVLLLWKGTSKSLTLHCWTWALNGQSGMLLNLWCIKFIHRINILLIVDERTPKHQLNLLLKSCTRLIIVEKNSLRCMVAFSLLHIFFHAALEHFETSNTVDMKLKGQGIWSIFQNASVTNIIAVILQIVSTESVCALVSFNCFSNNTTFASSSVILVSH